MRFLLSVIDFPSDPPTDDEADAIDTFLDRLHAGGHWVTSADFVHPTMSTVIDNRGDASLRTERRTDDAEWVAGFWIIEAANLEAALGLAAEGSKACNRQVEVRSLT